MHPGDTTHIKHMGMSLVSEHNMYDKTNSSLYKHNEQTHECKNIYLCEGPTMDDNQGKSNWTPVQCMDQEMDGLGEETKHCHTRNKLRRNGRTILNLN